MNGYQNPYFNPYGFMQQPQTTIPQSMPVMQVVRVSGENGAKAFQMGANASALLLDENGMIVWLAQTDGAGYKTVTPYDITPHKTTPAPNYGDLEIRIQTVEKRLEEIINGNSKRTASVGKKSSEDSAD